MYRKDFSRRPSYGGRAPSRSRAPKQGYLDLSKFINKAVADAPIEVFKPQHAFVDFPLDERLKRNIVSRGYAAPTPIQDAAIPEVLRGVDVVGIANTGTGKTAAFLIPLIDKVLKDPKQSILVVVPTRELATQIDQELRLFGVGLGMYSTCCVGGAPIGKQIRDLRFRNQFVIGTPGRLKDLIEQGVLNLQYFNTIVLDEADRMLDMGFINDIQYLVSLMPQPRHTLFFSATLSREIEKLIHAFLNDPVRISVKTRDTSKAVDQDVVRITPGAHKLDVLHDLLSKEDFEKVLIFGRTKHGVEKLSVMLGQRGIKVASIHGDKAQSQRQRALDQFKRSDVQALIATDVAARGLDIPNVTHVINYDLPATYEDYVHRIGRTGRGGKTGKALTFVD
jgi:ATP-dependent RNA helicase RhlE